MLSALWSDNADRSAINSSCWWWRQRKVHAHVSRQAVVEGRAMMVLGCVWCHNPLASECCTRDDGRM